VSEARAVPPLARTSARPFEVRVPGSKSETVRALVIAAQRPGATLVRGALGCDDSDRLAAALDAFDGLVVRRTANGFRVERATGRLGAPATPCDLGAAGTPARLLLAFAAAAEGATTITGDARLCERPMGDLVAALRDIGIRCEELGAPGRLPLRVHGGTPSGRLWRVRGDVSSQFASALLLLAAQQPAGPIRIVIEGVAVSRPYVELTRRLLERAGVVARRDAGDALVVHPGVPSAAELTVEPDATAAACFLAAAALTCTTAVVAGLGADSAQGDVAFAPLLRAMGCDVELAPDRIEVTGGPLSGVEVDLGATPDVALTLAALAAAAEGPTRITNVAHLRHKESDRLRAAASELARLGARVEEGADSLRIHPPAHLRAARIRTWNDHRVAMAFALLGLVAEGIEIEDPACVDKSFPGFWVELERFRAHHEG